MRYLIHVPAAPVDPRRYKFDSTAELNEVLPVVMDCETERQAMNYVRSRHFDAVAMPVYVALGSGQAIMLAVVPDPSRNVNPDEEIPCVMFVQCVAQDGDDRRRLRNDRSRAFDRNLWKVPVCKPELAKTYRVDLRATDLEVPSFTEARVGSINGRLTIYVEVGGIEMSLMFEDPQLQISQAPKSDALPIVLCDVRTSETSSLGDHGLEP